MPTLAAILRQEVRRLAAREVRRAQHTLRRLQKNVRALRARARETRRALEKLDRRVARLAVRVVATSRGARGERGGRRMAPEAIRAFRGRLGMSRREFALLVGVSPGSIFGWESGRTIPRGHAVTRLLELKGRGVRALLSSPPVAKAERRPVRRKRRRRA
jgi:DNA-binding transcriptional regulator YiaG